MPADLADVVAYASLAAATAALGVFPFLTRRRIPTAWLGWANALAAGLMLGASYLLTVEGLESHPLAESAGAALGVAVLLLTHTLSGTRDLTLDTGPAPGDAYAEKLWLRNAIHAAAEGTAIGAAMAVNRDFGIFVALAFMTHNVPEATALSAVLRSRGRGIGACAALSVASNLGQVALGAAAFLATQAFPSLLPAALGFPAGALVYLVTVELLPDSFQEAGHTTIAVLSSVALCAVVLVRGFFG
jgi:zinc transporter ZupT